MFCCMELRCIDPNSRLPQGRLNTEISQLIASLKSPEEAPVTFHHDSCARDVTEHQDRRARKSTRVQKDNMLD